MSKNSNIILVLGAAYAGLLMTHKLLRTLPSEYQVVLVSPSTHMYWNVAAPRAIAKNNIFGPDNSKVFAPITDAFSSHPQSRFRFIQGLASQLDPASNSCTITLVSNDAPAGTGATDTITYAHVVIATGSSAIDKWPFKSWGPHTVTAAALKDFQNKIAAARTIVLSGAGATGVETAGEIATFYPDKTVYMVSMSEYPLAIAKRPDIGATASKTLQQLGVTVKTGVKVVSESDKNGHTELVLSNGDRIQADLHIPTYGVLPNTSFVPKELLDDAGWVKVDGYTRAVGYENVWAVGDVATVGNRQAANAGAMSMAGYENLNAVCHGKGPDALKEYKEGELILVVPMGNKFAKGTGQLFGWKMWGFLVWALKGRSFFIDNLPGIASGKKTISGQKV